MSADTVESIDIELRPEPPTTSLAVFNPIASALAELRQRYEGLAFNLQTVKGNEEARQARAALVTLRNDADRAYTAWNAPILEQQKKAREMRDSIKAEVLALEQPIDEQIKADEARRAEEKRKRDEAERERVAANKGRIAAMFALPADVAGKKADDIHAALPRLEGLAGHAFDADFKDEAAAAYETVKVKLDAMLQAARAAEAEAERVRQEAARLAAEKAKLEAERADMERLRQEHAARLQAEREAAEAAERQRREAAAAAEREAQAAREAEAQRIAAQQAAERKRIADEEAAAKARIEAERAELAERQRKLDAEAAEIERRAAEEAAAAARRAQEQLDAFEAEKAKAREAAAADAAYKPEERNGSVEWAVAELAKLHAMEPGAAHGMADNILLDVLRANELGDVADAWQLASERVGFWYA